MGARHSQVRPSKTRQGAVPPFRGALDGRLLRHGGGICVRQPRRVGLGAGWLLGLLTDAGSGVLLGQHALAYSLLAFAAITLSRRMLWFSVWGQAVHVAALLLFAQGVALLVRLAAGADFPGWTLIVAPLLGAALWPVLSFMLLAPQRRPIEVDETRPI